MSCYNVVKIGQGSNTLFALQDNENYEINLKASKYLKHKTYQHCSPNTVQGIARAIAYYLAFMDENNITIDEVLELPYSSQHEHFVKFLYWLKAGNHNENNTFPNNNTCNSYLSHVFGYYEFHIWEYEKKELKVLRDKQTSYVNSLGVRFKHTVKTFNGYLPKEAPSKYREATAEMIEAIMNSSDNLRFKLMIRLLFETGLRIGELLGIKYDRDIDLENRTIAVTFDEDNENNARAKYSECRHVKMSEDTFKMLVHYMAQNRELLKKTQYLFINLKGEYMGRPMTVKGVYSELDLAFKKTGIRMTPHMLRHYFANERRKANWRIELISEALGHKNIQTTMRYLHIADEELEEASENYFRSLKPSVSISTLI